MQETYSTIFFIVLWIYTDHACREAVAMNVSISSITSDIQSSVSTQLRCHQWQFTLHSESSDAATHQGWCLWQIKLLPPLYKNKLSALNQSCPVVRFHWLTSCVAASWLADAYIKVGQAKKNSPTFDGGNTNHLTHRTHNSVRQQLMSTHSKFLETDTGNAWHT